MKNVSRRRFVARASKVSAAVLALMAGLVPELGKTAMVANALTAPAIPDGPPPTMDLAAQAALYSQALNDADVLLMTSTVGEPGRLDPPSLSLDYTSPETGQAAKQVFLPVRSYATGKTLAFVIYGSGMGIGQDGTLTPGVVKAIVGNTGSLQFSAKGTLYPTPVQELRATLFAYLFPTEYVDQRAPGPTRTAALDRPWGMFRKVMQATDNQALSDCIFKAKYEFNACIQRTNAALVAALIGMGLTLVCVGVSLLLGPASISLAYACAVMGVGSLGLVYRYKLQLEACAGEYDDKVANCRDQFKRT